MADMDEDTIPRSGPPAEDIDLSEETQDFRFLAAVSNEDAKIPKRGEKDFEPHATALQSNTLAASRLAMHNALSFQRAHQPKGYTTATYHPESNKAYALNPKGPLFAKMGHVLSSKDDPLGDDELRGNRLWLLPEEVLYLIERGTLDVRWPADEDDDDQECLPMSLQGAYAMFIGDEESHEGALTFERYSVYSGLKRMGYTVQRAPSWDGPGTPPGPDCYAPLPQQTWQPGLFNISHWWKTLFASQAAGTPEEQSGDQLVQPGLYRSYADIYRRLSLVAWRDPTTAHMLSQQATILADAGLRITYHVWKPGSQTFKKSAPGPPDFRIAVVNGRETSMPSLQQLSSLMDTVPYTPPKEDGQLYQKLRYGYKNVILAVVDQGVVSYLRIADAAFGRERLYERKAKSFNGKRGGRGGGRGGRGRGR
ncbi:hypothetical protein LTR08_006976 [Meristemomyces frigidus]|nr:hypothetical protein LTR08_006976 [Meristemomyces frigidus]